MLALAMAIDPDSTDKYSIKKLLSRQEFFDTIVNF